MGNQDNQPKDLLHYLASIHPLMWTLLVAFYAITKLTIVAHGSLPTILALINFTSISAIIISTFIASIVSIVGTVLFFSLIGVTEAVREGDRWLVAGFWLVVSTILAFVFMPKYLFATALYFTLWMIGSGLLIRYLWPLVKKYVFRSRKPVKFMPINRSRRGEIIVFTVLLIPLVVVASLSDKPWLPTERVLWGQDQTTIGYVISTDDTVTKILVARTRQVILVPNNDVKSRTICTLGGGDRSSLLFSTIAETPPYPNCE